MYVCVCVWRERISGNRRGQYGLFSQFLPFADLLGGVSEFDYRSDQFATCDNEL